MKASGDDHELDDDDNDEELAEPVEVRNERVQIWLDTSLSSTEIKSVFDSTVENKEMPGLQGALRCGCITVD